MTKEITTTTVIKTPHLLYTYAVNDAGFVHRNVLTLSHKNGVIGLTKSEAKQLCEELVNIIPEMK